jgi:hypothetical protein
MQKPMRMTTDELAAMTADQIAAMSDDDRRKALLTLSLASVSSAGETLAAIEKLFETNPPADEIRETVEKGLRTLSKSLSLARQCIEAVKPGEIGGGRA